MVPARTAGDSADPEEEGPQEASSYIRATTLKRRQFLQIPGGFQRGVDGGEGTVDQFATIFHLQSLASHWQPLTQISSIVPSYESRIVVFRELRQKSREPKEQQGKQEGFFQRLLQRRRPSVEEPERYDPAAYQLAAMREQQMLSKGGPASFSPLQVRNLRAPEMMPPMVLEDTETEDFSGEMQSTTASWSWSKPGYNWSKTTGSFTQSREPTKEPWTNPSNPSRDPPTKELRSEEVT